MDDFELRMAGIQRSFEKDGVPWSGGASIGFVMTTVETLRAELAAERKRIAALEKQFAGVQKAIDHTTKHALIFRGDWQAAESYAAGNVVRFRGAVFTALREVHPGKAEPSRQGSGWDLIV